MNRLTIWPYDELRANDSFATSAGAAAEGPRVLHSYRVRLSSLKRGIPFAISEVSFPVAAGIASTLHRPGETAMADTKDKVKKTIDNVAEKAKEATDSASEKAKEGATKVGEKVKEAGEAIKKQGS